jgi:hypothetical protein
MVIFKISPYCSLAWCLVPKNEWLGRSENVLWRLWIVTSTVCKIHFVSFTECKHVVTQRVSNYTLPFRWLSTLTKFWPKDFELKDVRHPSCFTYSPAPPIFHRAFGLKEQYKNSLAVDSTICWAEPGSQGDLQKEYFPTNSDCALQNWHRRKEYIFACLKSPYLGGLTKIADHPST